MLRSYKFLVVALVCVLVIYSVLLTAAPISPDAGSDGADYFARRPLPRRRRLFSRPQDCAPQRGSLHKNSRHITLPQPHHPLSSSKQAQQQDSSSRDPPPALYRQHQHQHQQQSTPSPSSPSSKRYLVYVPYAGATNQLISIWHATMIAKHLNRTLLLPNLSPNVHVQDKVEDDDDNSDNAEAETLANELDRRIKRGLQVPSHVRAQVRRAPGTRWSQFFDLAEYSRQVGVEIEELDDYLVRNHATQAELQQQGEQKDGEIEKTRGHQWLKRSQKQWLGGFWAGNSNDKEVRQPQQVDKSNLQDNGSPHKTLPDNTRTKVPIFPHPVHCYSEGGYGIDRRMDVTGKQFLTRYGISRKIRPTPYLNPKVDNGTVWARWRMDKVIERYQQPNFTQGEDERVLCLSHVYRLLPGGRNRAWVEFGQHFKYTQEVEAFVDEVLETLLKDWPSSHHRQQDVFGGDDDDDEQQYFGGDEGQESSSQLETISPMPSSSPSSFSDIPTRFVGLHLRRGDFERHCLGITSPADPNGWNRCYPSTQHVISLLSDQERVFRQAGLDVLSLPSPPSSSSSSTSSVQLSSTSASQLQSPTPVSPLPVLVLSNERDPRELAKSDAQGWIRVDHGALHTVERFGGYGPIMIDGALLARASLLVGVEYSTYFKTASLRAETWHDGRTLFVT